MHGGSHEAGRQSFGDCQELPTERRPGLSEEIVQRVQPVQSGDKRELAQGGLATETSRLPRRPRHPYRNSVKRLPNLPEAHVVKGEGRVALVQHLELHAAS